MDSNPEKISIVVLSYNSEQTVLQTLDSIASQTYLNIDLIVADDCSTDSTVELAQNWIDKNCGRFSDAKIVKMNKNGGTAANLNNGINYCSSKWVKIIAADDVLLEDCLMDCYQYVNETAYKIIQADEILFDGNGNEWNLALSERMRMSYFADLKSSEKQYCYLLRDDIRMSPTLFFDRNVFQKIGGCDLRIKCIEDYPLKLRFLSNGYKIGYLKKKIVKYRIGN